jgi:hypothetical protein
MKLPIQAQAVMRNVSTAKLNEGRVLPQDTSYGACTHAWPFFHGPECATSPRGNKQCCGGADQYAYIVEDSNGRVTDKGCGFCA